MNKKNEKIEKKIEVKDIKKVSSFKKRKKLKKILQLEQLMFIQPLIIPLSQQPMKTEILSHGHLPELKVLKAQENQLPMQHKQQQMMQVLRLMNKV